MDDCLFCNIINGSEEADFVFRENGVVAFRDKYPLAPTHVLVVPEEHIPSAHELDETREELLVRCLAATRRVADMEGVGDGYRLVTNIGAGGGQVISHLHFHVVGGRQLRYIDGAEKPWHP